MKLPAFQFYPGDWRKDPGVQALSYEERGIWIELLCLMHESESPGRLMLGGKPYPMDRLARTMGLTDLVMGEVISMLISLGVASLCPDTGAVMSRRMVRDRVLIQKRKEGGKKGGNPAFCKGGRNPYYPKDNLDDNHKDNHKDNHPDKQKITPSSSSSASTEATTILRPALADAVQWAKGSGVIIPPDCVRAWHDDREKIGWVTARGEHLIPIGNWQADLRRYASHWNEIERKPKNGSSTHQSSPPVGGSANAGRYKAKPPEGGGP